MNVNVRDPDGIFLQKSLPEARGRGGVALRHKLTSPIDGEIANDLVGVDTS